MFRLESGNPPVVSRKQFDCGIQLGFDVSADFKRANVEGSSTTEVAFQSFKGLPSYIDCSVGGPTGPSTPGDVTTLEQAKLQIGDLTARVTELQQKLADRNQQIGILQRRIAELSGTSPPPPDPVSLANPGVSPGPVGSTSSGAIEIELAAGATRVRITGAVDAPTLKAAVAALTDGRQR
jgi:hypothetical protein